VSSKTPTLTQLGEQQNANPLTQLGEQQNANPLTLLGEQRSHKERSNIEHYT
jgi:hypothetical protein